MPAGRQKSRTFRRIFVKTPGGKTVVHYRTRNPAHARCSCGAKLNGVPRLRPNKMRAVPKTKRRPERPYGGVLCSRCSRKKVIGDYVV